jgi:tetratricopeptide (TPR) repeat protein
LANIGDIYCKQGRYGLALEHLQQSLELQEEIGGLLGIARTLKTSGGPRSAPAEPPPP